VAASKEVQGTSVELVQTSAITVTTESDESAREAAVGKRGRLCSARRRWERGGRGRKKGSKPMRRGGLMLTSPTTAQSVASSMLGLPGGSSQVALHFAQIRATS